MRMIEPGTTNDAPALLDIDNASIATSHANFGTRPGTLEERLEWLARFAPTGPHQLLVAKDAGEVLGYACTSPYRDHVAFAQTVEVSVSLREASRGQGVGSALYDALFERISRAPVHVVLAGIALPNDASVALHRRFGFTTVGTFHDYAMKSGRYLSSVWMERLC